MAEHLGDDGYDVLSNFQGPFTLHPVMALALGVAGARLRLRSPKDSGGSFGVKQAVFPYVVAMCLASRKARCAVEWVEDRLEHLLAATSATNRVTTLEAAITGDGTIAALHWAAGIAHWSPGSLPEHAEPGLRETIFWSMPGLDSPDEDDRVNSSGAYGFIFDICGVEVDDTGRVRIDEYVTMHDAGTRLNPALVDGQIRGGFAHGVGAALYEELAYAGDGSFLSGTFADYLVPTACEVPAPTILHMESPSPFTPLGAKGVGEGNTMSTPVCLANAVADALDFDDVELASPVRAIPHAGVALACRRSSGRDRRGSSSVGGEILR